MAVTTEFKLDKDLNKMSHAEMLAKLGEIEILIDEIEDQRDKITAPFDEKIRKLRELYGKVELPLIKEMRNKETMSIGSADYVLTRTLTPRPTSIDWAGVYDWVLKTGDFSIMQKRMTQTVFKQLLEQCPDEISWAEVYYDEKVKLKRK